MKNKSIFIKRNWKITIWNALAVSGSEVRINVNSAFLKICQTYWYNNIFKNIIRTPEIRRIILNNRRIINSSRKVRWNRWAQINLFIWSFYFRSNAFNYSKDNSFLSSKVIVQLANLNHCNSSTHPGRIENTPELDEQHQ